MMLADINAGSSTPKLVSGILDWRKSKPEEGRLRILQRANNHYI
jgi:phosphomevalonate kinase